MAHLLLTLSCCVLLLGGLLPSGLQGDDRGKRTPVLVSPDATFGEVNGLIVVEAEHYFEQTNAAVRRWQLVHTESQTDDRSSQPESAQTTPDPDPPHLTSASGGAYLEALPDTRTTHDDKLVNGENFFPQPGQAGVLSYRIRFDSPGRYHVWVRAYSTGTEDNGIHVGLNGTWPASGQRWQTVAKNKWHWDSRQRTQEVHTGVPGQLYLDVERPGVQTVQFSIREDGFEFDKFLLTKDKGFVPEWLGPEETLVAGQVTRQFDYQPPPFPAHWGSPPLIGTTDYRPLPRDYGFGGSTLANWISQNISKDEEAAQQQGSVAPAKPVLGTPLVQPREPHGTGAVTITGELKTWHKVTLTLDGPYAHERDTSPNPFTDYRMTVTFQHESGSPVYLVPGYFAADGHAGETSAEQGTKWRAHLSPDKQGVWNWKVSFQRGKLAAVDDAANLEQVTPYDGRSGSFSVASSDKQGRDFRARGRLQYVGERYLKFAGSGEYFLKAGPDAPETLLGYADFDNTVALKQGVPLKTWAPHVQDWKPGDPLWKGDKGKGLIGALNYLAGKGLNAFSFLTYNAGGDGDNVWPFIDRDLKLHYDCSKLDQWGMVFDHATALGLYLHFKLQENEIDDNRVGDKRNERVVPESLDGGLLGTERKLYCRELIARFGHNLALNWNIGEENTQSPEEVQAMAAYLHETDPYQHHIVIHTFPNQQDEVYPHLLGEKSLLSGASLQNSWSAVHERTLKWIKASQEAGRVWVVANDEQNPASDGVPPDPGYQGHSGEATDGRGPYTLHDIRQKTLWGNLLAGGAGVEYYFGYKLPQNDLICEDFRSRDRSWDYCRVALEFFQRERIPFWEMTCHDELVGASPAENSRYCFARPGDLYLVYLIDGGTASLHLTDQSGKFGVRWFNPREGGELRAGSVTEVSGGQKVSLGNPPEDANEDWLIVVRKAR